MFSSRKTSTPSGGILLTKSLRFRSSASAYLSRTPASATNQKTWTFSAWLKRGTISTSEITLFGKADTYISVNSNQLNANFNSGGSNYFITSSAVLVDPSAWYHVVLVLDTTQATAANRASMYVNGVKITSFATSTYTNMAQNYNAAINTAAAHAIGRYSGATPGAYLDGYMTDVYFIDGQALTPSSFGATNATTGQWSPATYSGSYGTNGFHLTFTNTTSTTTLGYDTSGNSNNWTTNNISLTAGSTYDSMNDVPVAYSATAANYAVQSPLYPGSSTITNGNLQSTSSTTTVYSSASSFQVNNGKWYWEVTATTINGTNNYPFIGAYRGIPTSLTGAVRPGGDVNGFSYRQNGSAYVDSTNPATWGSIANGDVIGVALDLTNLQVSFYKNNVLQGTITGLVAGTYTPADSEYNGSSVAYNFGQQPFTYTPPTGFVALNTYNLPTPTIAQGNKYMDATLYTGTGASASITNTASFKPDLVWIKSRSAATDHKLTDSVRGVTKGLISDTTGAETTDTQGLTAFNSNGFTLGTDTNYNNTSATYVGWQWQAGAGTSGSNTNGSITSTVSANTTSGFSIVTYTGTGTAGTIGHGLGVAPSMIIVKSRSATGDWPVYHSSLGNGSYVLLDTTAASAASSTIWNATSPTSSVFSVGINTVSNTITVTYVAYCFTPIAGFSAFGSYTGGSSTLLPFVYCGFRPRFIMIKNTGVYTSAYTSWYMIDTARLTGNISSGTEPSLWANLSAAEGNRGNGSTTDTYDYVNILSNGFQVAVPSMTDELNTSGNTYIYAAFAENPFKYANAR